MAKEWAPRVRANTIAPRPLRDDALEAGGPLPPPRSAVAHTLLQRMAPFEEIVPHVLYLASDASAFVTGQDVIVDGGITTGVPVDMLARAQAEFRDAGRGRGHGGGLHPPPVTRPELGA